MAILTMISTLKTPENIDSPIFIPMELKYKNPKLFGEYLAKQNKFLNLHRNVAIVGLVPDIMDCKNDGDGKLDLFSSISKLPGVYRCDPTRRTPDLRKWNISCNAASHPDICRWIDNHLVAI
jgi:hypothetical protein